MEQDHFIEIETYLNGELSESEEKNFIQKVSKDPTLKAALFNHVLANKAIDELLRQKTVQKLEIIKDKVGEPFLPKTSKRVRPIALLAAASLAALILTTTWLYFTKSLNMDKLVDNYYEIASAPTVLRSPNATIQGDEKMELGRYEFFVKENFEAAISLFNSVPNEYHKFIDAQYYLAHCYLKTDEFAQAIDKFQFLLASEKLPKYVKQEELEWNLLLSYFANRQEDEFRKLLADFSERPDLREPYKSKIVELKSELK